MKIKSVVFVAIAILSTIVYINSLNNGFHFDDYHHIYKNPYIRSLSNIPLFFIETDTFSIYGGGHYRPLLMTSYAINYFFSRLNPPGYHIGNLVLHIFVSYLLFITLVTILGKDRFFPALAASSIFAIHPFNSEAINYITARSSIMASLFYLLAFYLWVRFRKYPSRKYYILSLIAFSLGMLTKEILVTLPVILWLYDIYYSISPAKRDKGYVKPFYASIKSYRVYIPYILFVIIPYIIIRTILIGNRVTKDPLQRGFVENLLMETKVLAKYIYLLFLPINLAVEHAISEVASLFEWQFIGSIILLIALSILCLFLYKRNDLEWKTVSFFISWFFISMLPTTLIPLSAPLQENRGYLGGVGFAVFLGTVINKIGPKKEYAMKIRWILLFILIVTYAYGTIYRNLIWIDDYTLWLDAVRKSPGAWRAHSSLAESYQKLGFIDLAIEEYKKADLLKKDYTPTINKLGLLYLRQGRLDLALHEFNRALAMKPDDIESHANLAKVYLKSGQLELAKRECIYVANEGRKRGLTTIEYRYVQEAIECARWFMEKERGKDKHDLTSFEGDPSPP